MNDKDTPASAAEIDERLGLRLTTTDSQSAARLGKLVTRRGTVQLPAFMPVGTQATVKSLSPDDVAATGSEILLANTYHLMLRPGVDLIRDAGGLHQFMAWSRPILTDSGGFQVYSLAHRRKVTEAGVEFRSHLDGSKHELTPERAIDLQLGFDSDVIMPLDDVVGYDGGDQAQHSAMDRTHRWLRRAIEHFDERTDVSARNLHRPLLFGIVQGGFDGKRRRESARAIDDANVDGCAIGGLSVGEPKPLMLEMLEHSISNLPSDRPRYLMGVGSPEDLWQSVALGVDMFDCVHPTRVARRGALFTFDGRVNVTSARFRREFSPVDPTCDCETCQTFSAAYLHHLFHARELLAYRLATIHNLRFMQRMMGAIRASIESGTFKSEMAAFLDRYRTADVERAAEQKRKWVEARDLSSS
ncbi:MAG: tRNA guanosine(34) transglycosylase Tgt [Nitrolancea sp.]